MISNPLKVTKFKNQQTAWIFTTQRLKIKFKCHVNRGLRVKLCRLRNVRPRGECRMKSSRAKAWKKGCFFVHGLPRKDAVIYFSQSSPYASRGPMQKCMQTCRNDQNHHKADCSLSMPAASSPQHRGLHSISAVLSTWCFLLRPGPLPPHLAPLLVPQPRMLSLCLPQQS